MTKQDQPHPCSTPAHHLGRCLGCGSRFIRREAAPQAFEFCSHSCHAASRFREVDPDQRHSERARR